MLSYWVTLVPVKEIKPSFALEYQCGDLATCLAGTLGNHFVLLFCWDIDYTLTLLHDLRLFCRVPLCLDSSTMVLSEPFSESGLQRIGTPITELPTVFLVLNFLVLSN